MVFRAWKIQDIKAYLNTLPTEQWLEVSVSLMRDQRHSVNKMGEGLRHKLDKMASEHLRLEKMSLCEKALSMNAARLCGVDEAGRGPLAGPVVAAAVILPPGFMPQGLNDSKKVSEPHRNLLYEQIVGNAVAWGVGVVDPQRIDEINILEATREAMVAAVRQMSVQPDFILLDAVEIKYLEIAHKGIIKGDEKCLSIAAASIIAKVTRDRLMWELSETCPGYGFQIHKGYGTTGHYEALRRHGLTEHHRRSFLKNW